MVGKVGTAAEDSVRVMTPREDGARVGHVELQRAVWVLAWIRPLCLCTHPSGGRRHHPLSRAREGEVTSAQPLLVAVWSAISGLEISIPLEILRPKSHVQIQTSSRLEAVVQPPRATKRHSPTLFVLGSTPARLPSIFTHAAAARPIEPAGHPANAIDTVRNLASSPAPHLAAEIKLDCKESKQMPIPSRKLGETLHARHMRPATPKPTRRAKDRSKNGYVYMSAIRPDDESGAWESCAWGRLSAR